MSDAGPHGRLTAQQIERIDEVVADVWLLADVEIIDSRIRLLIQDLLAEATTRRQALEQERDRLVKQARDISDWLVEAGVGACPIPEGVRLLLARAETAEADLAACREHRKEQQRAWREIEVRLREMLFNHEIQLREAHALAVAQLPEDDSDLPSIEELRGIFDSTDERCESRGVDGPKE